MPTKVSPKRIPDIIKRPSRHLISSSGLPQRSVIACWLTSGNEAKAFL